MRLKVKHIDSAQKIIRIEQSKGRKDRNVMLSAETLDLLRQWWKVRPSRHDAGTPREERWLFPGAKRGKTMSTRQLSRLFHEAADAAGIRKEVSLHVLRHTRVATGMIARIESPLDLLSLPRKKPRKVPEKTPKDPPPA